jgi:3-dehydrosphinganine reductase
VANLRGQHVIITGGSSGIGRAMAKVYVRRGAHVSILGRRQEQLDQTLGELEDLRIDESQRFEARSVDVSDFARLKQAMDSLMADGYPADILVNAAGIVHCGYFENLSMDDFYRTIEVDLYGTVNAVKAVVPTMMKRKTGRIANFSSVLGFISSFGYTSYCAAKFGVRGFSDALRHELRPYGIRVYCIFPQDTDTPQLHQERQMQPLESRRINEGANRVLDVHRVARAIVRGIERRNKYILPGLAARAYFQVFDGPRILSGIFAWYFVDRIVARVRRDCEMGIGSAEPPEAAA